MLFKYSDINVTMSSSIETENAIDSIKKSITDLNTNIKGLKTSFDVPYDTVFDSKRATNTNIVSQHAKLLAEKKEILNEIKGIDDKITAKEVEFVDIQKNSGGLINQTRFFTQQDYLTMMLFIAYIVLGVSFYWRSVVTNGFSLKGLFMFLAQWAAVSLIAFALFRRFV